ncbi:MULTISPECIES: amino acid ABC transporter permease [Chelatococcus]|uniref:Polar amino acid transport system permease protein/cystine transport system permease protein n=1 Tax=Chelatococcus caeni TaxID=1348468 RepID=A0A840BYP2_9HYPH|nr:MULTISPECIES: amino acid ABC transporter permease [Chelatococcus]MBB4018455.1 polar amino acid transport system permease protein/cystine transport system permease protein [Chelatococcus caeni]
MGFKFEYLLSILPDLALAALVNVRLAAVIIAIALMLGTMLTVLRSLKLRPVNAVVAIVISFVRGTPLLIQIFIAYYVLPAVGLDLTPEVAGIAAISFNSMVFVSESMRGGLASIDPGPLEAATALGLRPPVIWWKVVLPQLFRRIAPVLINEATIVVKGTALLSVITVVDVLRTAQQMASSSYRPFETLVGAALVFLVVNLAISLAGKTAEARFAATRM